MPYWIAGLGRATLFGLCLSGAGGAFAATPGAAGATLAWQGAGQRSFLAPARAAPLLSPSRGGLLGGAPARPLFGPDTASGAVAPVAPPVGPSRAAARVAALIANPPRDFSNLGDLGCIAVSIYHEARNQPAEGQYAVGSVILTRAATPDRWGGTACAVVQPVQFSYLTPERRFEPILEPAAWARAVRIAAQVIHDGPAPALGGADHYHATYVDPVWNRHMTAIGRIADHVFWRSDTLPR